jgi:hypothetical protein
LIENGTLLVGKGIPKNLHLQEQCLLFLFYVVGTLAEESSLRVWWGLCRGRCGLHFPRYPWPEMDIPID